MLMMSSLLCGRGQFETMIAPLRWNFKMRVPFKARPCVASRTSIRHPWRRLRLKLLHNLRTSRTLRDQRFLVLLELACCNPRVDKVNRSNKSASCTSTRHNRPQGYGLQRLASRFSACPLTLARRQLPDNSPTWSTLKAPLMRATPRRKHVPFDKRRDARLGSPPTTPIPRTITQDNPARKSHDRIDQPSAWTCFSPWHCIGRPLAPNSQMDDFESRQLRRMSGSEDSDTTQTSLMKDEYSYPQMNTKPSKRRYSSLILGMTRQTRSSRSLQYCSVC
ncbi:hypothetical protein MRB53_039519 [Persea americana]|nr:hypothetical protein MRB53_039519 [Persea americana]